MLNAGRPQPVHLHTTFSTAFADWAVPSLSSLPEAVEVEHTIFTPDSPSWNMLPPLAVKSTFAISFAFTRSKRCGWPVLAFVAQLLSVYLPSALATHLPNSGSAEALLAANATS